MLIFARTDGADSRGVFFFSFFFLGGHESINDKKIVNVYDFPALHILTLHFLLSIYIYLNVILRLAYLLACPSDPAQVTFFPSVPRTFVFNSCISLLASLFHYDINLIFPPSIHSFSP